MEAWKSLDRVPQNAPRLDKVEGQVDCVWILKEEPMGCGTTGIGVSPFADEPLKRPADMGGIKGTTKGDTGRAAGGPGWSSQQGPACPRGSLDKPCGDQAQAEDRGAQLPCLPLDFSQSLLSPSCRAYHHVDPRRQAGPVTANM